MNVIGEKLSNAELLSIKGGCDITCYCESLWCIMTGEGNGINGANAAIAYNDHNCPQGSPGDPGYPGSGSYSPCPLGGGSNED